MCGGSTGCSLRHASMFAHQSGHGSGITFDLQYRSFGRGQIPEPYLLWELYLLAGVARTPNEMMKAMLSVLVLSLSAIMLAGCSEATGSQAPKVGSTYQEKLDKAWDIAGKGEAPVIACATVVGTAVGMQSAGRGDKSEATQAYEACYIDVFVHYANAFMKTADHAKLDGSGQPKGCIALFKSYAVHTNALGSFAKDFELDPQTLKKKIHANFDEKASLCLPLISSM